MLSLTTMDGRCGNQNSHFLMTMSDCQKPQTKNNEPIKGGTGTALFLLAELIVHVPYFIMLKYAEHKAIDKGRLMM